MSLALMSACDDSALEALRSPLREERVVMRLETEAPGKLRAALARAGVDVLGSSRREGFVDVVAQPAEIGGFSLKSARTIAVDPRSLSGYRDPDALSAALDTVQAAHPAIARKVALKTDLPEGHALFALKISDNVEVDEDEPTFLMDGQIHAREVMTAEIMLDAIEQLTDGYGVDAALTRFVDELEIWIIPSLNPDGAAWVFSSDSTWRKNRRRACSSAVGVDLNRNFGWNHASCPGSSSVCSADNYQGPGPGSEPETEALSGLLESLRPLYYLSYHSFGEYIFWPTGCGRTEEEPMLAEIGAALNAKLPDDTGQTGQYEIGTPADILYQAPGGAHDHAYGAAGAIGMTIEVNSASFQPNFATWRDRTCQSQRQAWRFFLERTLDGPSVRGHVRDAVSLAPLSSTVAFPDHPFTSGQNPLRTDAAGRFGRVVRPGTQQTLVFSAPGYLPARVSTTVATGPVELEVLLKPGANHPPEAEAGPDLVATEGDWVGLDGSGSRDPDGQELSFTWIQRSGPLVRMDDAHAVRPRFFAPGVTGDQRIQFALIASDGELEAEDTVAVAVRDRFDNTQVFEATGLPEAIRDRQTLRAVISVGDDLPILRASVRLDITHPFIGDLRISLAAPSGTSVVLKEPSSSPGANLHRDFELLEVRGERSGGDWTLSIADLSTGDEGSLERFALTLELAGQTRCVAPSDCDLPNVALPFCEAGRCGIAGCTPGFSDCDLTPEDGCEVDVLRDLENCGGCDEICRLEHAEPQCLEGACTVGGCLAPWADCDGVAENGCEADTTQDAANCGGCGAACDLPDASALCAGGACRVETCRGPTGDCDGNPSNGCEADLTDEAHCGQCGLACHLGEGCLALAAGYACGPVCDDRDGDAHSDRACGGDDCDDGNAAIHPGAAEICGDDLDQDCDGEDSVCLASGSGCATAGADGFEIALGLLLVFGWIRSRREPSRGATVFHLHTCSFGSR